MIKFQLVLALGLVAGCSKSVQAQSPIEVNVKPPDYAVSRVAGGGQDFHQQLPYDLVYSGLLDQLASAPGLARQIPSDLESTIWTETADDASYSAKSPQSTDEGWAARSLLMVCALATLLRNSYYKAYAA